LPLNNTVNYLLKNLAFNVLSRKDTVPIFSHVVNHSTHSN